MYVEIKSDSISEVHHAIDSALNSLGEGQHARLTLEKNGDYYILSVVNNLSVCIGCDVCKPNPDFS